MNGNTDSPSCYVCLGIPELLVSITSSLAIRDLHAVSRCNHQLYEELLPSRVRDVTVVLMNVESLLLLFENHKGAIHQCRAL